MSDIAIPLTGLRVEAPPTVASRSLIEIGLADAYAALASPIGDVFVAWNGRGLSAIGPADDDAFEDWFARDIGRPLYPADRLPDRLERAIDRRLAGDRSTKIRLDLRGSSPFEQSVWMKAAQIPFGEVRPYGWVAAEIGKPLAMRAVGSALGRNPIPLVIPCHRVVRTDGTIGEYALGSDKKRAVLTAEGVDLARLEGLASSGIRYIGSDTTKIFCLPTCRHARRVTDRHRVEFHSQAEGQARGYRACRVCRPGPAGVAA
ncbi:MAG TPA: methylated-DNA--[protein]-cysteine S-methyltransferase [Candidatus Limnocylindrales bacterium]|nr:methylated-DNA--[protein]-cysteine S-methyltransferase [Candidatus Limnocylindrales bacterium]